MDSRHIVAGLLPEDVAAGDVVLMRLEGAQLINGSGVFKWRIIPVPDQRKMAESAINKVDTQDAFAIASSILVLADAVKDATGRLSEIDDALRNTIGGSRA